MKVVFSYTKFPFVILIDEWDCLFREYKHSEEAQKKYLDFLRAWLKDQSYVALAYMTGILPVKKYGSHSALNMFTEYSMTEPGDMAPYFGFTEDEVQTLCETYQMNYEEARAWYDGYGLIQHSKDGDICYSMYSPKSVVEAMLRHKFGTYWNQTETYEALKLYIQMNLDGLKDAVVQMLAGETVPINTGTFANDMTSFSSKDDVLTLLVHLGYLTYDSENETVAIPNKEVSQEYINAISTMGWHEVMDAVQASRKLLQALWNMDADICYIPRKLYADKPAIVVELKWDKAAEGAIAQIKEKQYVNALKEYRGNLLLAGINYDRETKKHYCIIEKLIME